MADLNRANKSSTRQVQKEKLKAQLEVKQFNPNAILRGAQLTVVGALRALQNPSLFTSDHYKQAAYAVAAGIAIRLLVAIPVCHSILSNATSAIIALTIAFSRYWG